MPKEINWYKKASRLVIAFVVLAVITNLISFIFFSFNELAADGVTYTKDFSPLWQSAFYLAICALGAYFIGHENKVVTVIAGLFAALIGLSTFWLSLFSDGTNLLTAFETSQGGFDPFVIRYLFYFGISLISIALCIMITATTFKAVFSKK